MSNQNKHAQTVDAFARELNRLGIGHAGVAMRQPGRGKATWRALTVTLLDDRDRDRLPASFREHRIIAEVHHA